MLISIFLCKLDRAHREFTALLRKHYAHSIGNWLLLIYWRETFSQLYQCVFVVPVGFQFDHRIELIWTCFTSLQHVRHDFKQCYAHAQWVYGLTRTILLVIRKTYPLCTMEFHSKSVLFTWTHWPIWPVLKSENFKSILVEICSILRLSFILYFFQSIFKFSNISQK